MIDNYLEFTEGGNVTIDLTRHEEAHLLLAVDHGVKQMEKEEIEILENILEKMVKQIWE